MNFEAGLVDKVAAMIKSKHQSSIRLHNGGLAVNLTEEVRPGHGHHLLLQVTNDGVRPWAVSRTAACSITFTTRKPQAQTQTWGTDTLLHAIGHTHCI